MKRHPLVSVIMTAYNHEQFVGEAIESILAQTLRDFELVVVDDGSNDGTLQVLRSFESDDRVIVIPQPRIGRGRALNLAIEHAHGEYIAIMDADDLSLPDRLEKQVAYLREHPEIGALGGQKRLMYDGVVSDRACCVSLTDVALRRVLPRHNAMVHISAMMPRSIILDVGGYDETLRVALDYDLWIRVASRYQLANLADVLVIERVHDSAFFRNIALWNRLKTLMGVRWRAWRKFSGNPLGLWFVVAPFETLQLFLKHKCPRIRWLYYVLTNHPSVTASVSSVTHDQRDPPCCVRRVSVTLETNSERDNS